MGKGITRKPMCLPAQLGVQVFTVDYWGILRVFLPLQSWSSMPDVNQIDFQIEDTLK